MAAVMSSGPLLAFVLCWTLLSIAHGINCPDKVEFTIEPGQTCVHVDFQVNGKYVSTFGWEGGDELRPGHDCFPEGDYGYTITAGNEECSVTVYVKGVCSWHPNHCWPGACASNLASNCVCRSGFSPNFIYHSDGYTIKRCKWYSLPDLDTCRVAVTDSQGTSTNSTTSGPKTDCSSQRNEFIKTQPTHLFFVLKADFNKTFGADDSPHVSETKIGIVGAHISVVKRPLAGSTTTIVERNLQSPPLCKQRVSATNPVTGSDQHVCEATLTLPPSKVNLHDGDRVCAEMRADAGGYYKLQDYSGNYKGTETFPETHQSRTICFIMDQTKPAHHCISTGGGDCASDQPMTLSTRVTRSRHIKVSINGWTDPGPSGYSGYSVLASGLAQFRLEVHKVHAGQNSLTVLSTAITALTKEWNASASSPGGPYEVSLTLPGAGEEEEGEGEEEKARMYGVLLEVHDKVQNVAYTRRLVLLDNSSSVELHPATRMTVVHAEPKSDYKWQTDVTKELCVKWPGRFYNTDMVRNNLLKKVEPADSSLDIHGHYDQISGTLPISGTDNVDGITKFEMAWSLNEGQRSEFTEVDLHAPTTCFQQPLHDGETYDMWIRASDIMGNSKEDSVRVSIDHTGPDVNVRGLLGRWNTDGLYVHNNTDLSKMTLVLRTADPHSGLSTIHWTLSTQPLSDDVGRGAVGVQRLDNTTSCTGQADCYCPIVGSCEADRYLVTFTNLVQHHTHQGDHHRHYHITVTVTNWASLSTTSSLKILLDESPPSAGTVWEGLTADPQEAEGRAEMDFTSSPVVHVHWHGFQDKESGISLYRVVMAERCVTAREVDEAVNATEVKQGSKAFFTFPAEGRYFFSVLAYNGALEPSQVACSDGVVYDTTPPTLCNVTITHARGGRTLGCTQLPPQTWLVNENLTRVALSNTTRCQAVCSGSSPGLDVEHLPLSSTHVEELDVSEQYCQKLTKMSADSVMVLPSDYIKVTWQGHDEESQMEEFNIGIGRDMTTASSPDFLPFTSTEGHSSYHVRHLGLGQGDPFFLFLRVTSKAGLSSTLTLGPVLIDVTAPEVTQPLVAVIEEGLLLVTWPKGVFVDPEQPWNVDLNVSFRIGHDDGFVTPFHTVTDSTRSTCQTHGVAECAYYPVRDLHAYDTDYGRSFFFQLHVINAAGYVTTVNTSSVRLPSHSPPSHAVILDVLRMAVPEVATTTEPSATQVFTTRSTSVHGSSGASSPPGSSSTSTTSPLPHLTTESSKTASIQDQYSDDVDAILKSEEVCVAWKGFYHEEEIEVEVGIGTKANHDDIIQFHSAKSQSPVCLSLTSLPVNTKLFSVVKATSSGGTSVFSSDGFVIVPKTDPENLIKVFTGKGCHESHVIGRGTIVQSSMSFSVSGNSIPALHAGDFLFIELSPFIPHVVFQNATLLQTTFTGYQLVADTPTITAVLPHPAAASTSLQIQHCQKDSPVVRLPNSQFTFVWETTGPSTSYVRYFKTEIIDTTCLERTNATGEYLFQKCSLHSQKVSAAARELSVYSENLDSNFLPDHTYVSSISPCFDDACLPPVTSEPSTYGDGHVTVQFQQGTIVDMDQHQMTVEVQASVVPAPVSLKTCLYMWTISADRSGSVPLADWLVHDSPNCSHIQIQHQTAVRGRGRGTHYVCLSLLYPVRSPHPGCLKLRRSPTTHLHEPFHVIELSHSTFRETDLDPWMASQQLGSRLHDLYDLDLDFAPSDVLLSAVLTNSLNLSVTWFLVTSPRAPSSGDCAGDKECVTSKTAGGHVTFPRHLSKLQSGNIYYVCAAFVDADGGPAAAAGSQAVQQQFCGDGVVIDDNAPVGGSVAISSANKGYLTGDSHVLVTWSGFADVEIDIPLLQDSITLNYSVSLGTYPGAEDLAPFVPVGQRASWTFRHLSFRSGITCVATVRAQDRAGHVTEVSSDQKIYDRTPPVIHHLAAGPTTAEYSVPGHQLPVHWASVEDRESGVDRMEVGVAQPGGGDTVIDFQSCQGTSAVLTNTSGLVDGHHYIVLLKVSNKAGLTTVKSSAPFVVDSSPPSLGRLWHNDTDTTILGGYSTHVGVYSVRWSGFTDPHSGVDYYKVGLGSSAGQTDVVPFVYVGRQTTYTWKRALEQGTQYYVTLQACNRAGLCRVTSSSSLTFDDSPPTSGHVTVGLYGRHEKFLGHNSSLPVQWTGFSDPQTGIQHFTCCVGRAPRSCDVIASTHTLLSRSVHVTSAVTLPPATPLYVTVTAVNPAGLETSSVSDSFVVDSTPPEVASKPQFLSPRDGSPVSSQWDRSVLHVTWLFRDPESSVVSHTVYVRSQLSGRLVVDPIILGPETQLTLTLDRTSVLTDGDKHWASVSACNAAHLCVVDISDLILIDSTPPVTGTFQSPLTWKQGMAQSEGDTLTVIDIRWSGFSDAESDMTGYEVIAGREYNGEELSGGRVSVPHDSTAPIQRYRLQITEQLRAGDVLHLAVLAENTLHLRSPLVRSAFDCLQDSASGTSGTLELIRHSCDASYCTLECTCAAEGQVCRGSAEPCVELNSTEVELSGLQVLPMMGASLEAQNSSAPPLHVFIPNTKQTYLTSSKCLEGHWSLTQPQPLLNVSRFEYSFSLANMSAGEGVINTQTEPVWYDVGRGHMTALHCLPGNRTLTAGHRYVLHVRVWTSRDRHVTFTSSPVTHDPSPPRVKRGQAVLDSDGTCSHDVDYVTTERSEVTACWKGVFGDSQSLVVRYHIWMGTSPKASNHHALTDAGLNTSWTFPTGPLEPGTRYYVTVRAWNGAGLHATAVSDGFLVDVTPPVPGVVFASGHHSNRHAQSSASAISASWHGFEDGQCGVRSYQVAVMDAGNSSVPDTFLDVGRKTRVRLTNLILTHGHSYQVAVKATDAAGLESQAVESTAILVDVTPPEGVTCTQFQAAENVTLTPSFTPFHLEDSYRADWELVATETGEVMRVEVVAATTGADATLAGYLRAADLRMPLSFHPSPSQAGVFRARHTFLSPYSGQLGLQVVVEGPARATLRAQLSRCQHTRPASSSQPALTLRQTSPSTISVCCHVRDQESGLQTLMVGLGTTPGGLQVRPWTRVGYSGHLSLDVHAQQHATTLYAAALAQNHAGQWSRFLSAPVVLDKTGPVVSEVTLTLRYGEGEGQGQVTTTVWAEGSWSAHDAESGVEGCSCRLDGQEVEGSTEQWTPGRSGTTTTNGHCQWTLSDPRHGSEVTVSVTCHNTAGLRTIVTSLPVMVLLHPPSLTEVTLDSLSNYVLMSPYDRSTPRVRSGNSSLQFFWRGIQDPTVMQYYFRFLLNTKALTEWSPLDVYKTTAVWGRMGGKSGNGDVTVELQAVNGRNVTSETLSLTVTLDDTKPLLTGKTATLSVDDGELSLDWRHVFDVTRDVTYSVYAGTEEGYGNVINHVTTALTHYQGYAADTSTTLYVIIQAVYDNGMSATYTDTLEL